MPRVRFPVGYGISHESPLFWVVPFWRSFQHGQWVGGLTAGLQVGQALRCPSYSGLGSAVPASMFLGTQPPSEVRVLNGVKCNLT